MTIGLVSHISDFLAASRLAIAQIDPFKIHEMVSRLRALRHRGGRLFIVGVGGGAANASHAVCDFRKLCGIEAYSPADNVAELTARTNDEGWNTVFAEWLATSRATDNDVLLVLSVGGGDLEKNVSANIAEAVIYAHRRGMVILGVVGRDVGVTAQLGTTVLVVKVDPAQSRFLTPIVESLQVLVWHCLVSHPDLQIVPTKW